MRFIVIISCFQCLLLRQLKCLPVLQEIYFSAILLLYVVVRISMHQSLMVKSLTFCGHFIETDRVQYIITGNRNSLLMFIICSSFRYKHKHNCNCKIQSSQTARNWPFSKHRLFLGTFCGVVAHVLVMLLQMAFAFCFSWQVYADNYSPIKLDP